MIDWIILVSGSALIIWYSIPSLRKPGSHGFYRFFAWEIILFLFLLNRRIWFANPFTWFQLISWLLLIICIVPVIAGYIQLRSAGKPDGNFEATTQLVTMGIYSWIRHPLYASLIYLTWGIFFKSPSIVGACFTMVATAFLYATARADEIECLDKFGHPYAVYMRKTKRFIPFVY